MTANEIRESINQKESEIQDHKNFLSSKDYQTIREVQGGEPMSEETKHECALARNEINRLENEIAELKLVVPEADPSSIHPEE